MRTLERNKVTFYYCLYDGKEAVVDADGNETGEYRVIYKEAQPYRGNVSKAYGEAQVRQFGNAAEYDKVIIVEGKDCPIDENSVLFVDREPQYDSHGSPLYDYIVKRAAPTLYSGIGYWVQKVR